MTIGTLPDTPHDTTSRHAGLASLALGGIVGFSPAIGEGAVAALALCALLVMVLVLALRRGALGLVMSPLGWVVLAYLAGQFGLLMWHDAAWAAGQFAPLFAIPTLLLVLLRGLLATRWIQTDHLAKGAVIGLGLSVLLLGLDYVYQFKGAQCRAEAFSGNPQWAAAIMACLVPQLFVLRLRRDFVPNWAIHALMISSFVAVSAFTGARMAAYTSATMFLLGSALLFALRQWRTAGQLLISFLIGVVLLFVVDHYRACTLGDRLLAQIQYAPQILLQVLRGDDAPAPAAAPTPTATPSQKPAPNPPRDATAAPDAAPDVAAEVSAAQFALAGGSRAVLWNAAWAALKGHWALGIGRPAEIHVAGSAVQGMPFLTHVHNQYLSWMLWGGLTGLALGIALLLAPLLLGHRGMGLAFAAPWVLMLMTESYLALSFNLNIFVMLLVLAERLATPRAVN